MEVTSNYTNHYKGDKNAIKVVNLQFEGDEAVSGKYDISHMLPN